jgi:hypothetical protein
MAKKFFLERNMEILKNNSDKTKGDLLRMFELVTYLAVNKEISLDDATNYAYILFKMLEEVGES